MNHDLFERASETALAITEIVPVFPKIAVILGSGMGDFVEGMADTEVIPYGRLPHFPSTTVEGHHGNLVVGRIGATPVAALQGRFHSYEGHDLATVTYPVRVMQRLGVETLILTAATGGIRGDLTPGDILVLSDHLNLIGANPLRGANDARFGVRFPEMSSVYSPRLRELARNEGAALGHAVSEGVYACLPGPSYETPAEIRMLRALGADVVGMSTVPEAIVARHAHMEVLAFAIVSNLASGIAERPITHEEVLEAGRVVGPRLSQIIRGVIAKIGYFTVP